MASLLNGNGWVSVPVPVPVPPPPFQNRSKPVPDPFQVDSPSLPPAPPPLPAAPTCRGTPLNACRAPTAPLHCESKLRSARIVRQDWANVAQSIERSQDVFCVGLVAGTIGTTVASWLPILVASRCREWQWWVPSIGWQELVPVGHQSERRKNASRVTDSQDLRVPRSAARVAAIGTFQVPKSTQKGYLVGTNSRHPRVLQSATKNGESWHPLGPSNSSKNGTPGSANSHQPPTARLATKAVEVGACQAPE